MNTLKKKIASTYSVLGTACRHLIKVACGKKARKKLVACYKKFNFIIPKRPVFKTPFDVVSGFTPFFVAGTSSIVTTLQLSLFKQKSEISWLM